MTPAEVKVLIRYIQILFSFVLLLLSLYLGLSWASHKIGVCMVLNGECQGPFYHVRHIAGVVVMSCVLFFSLVPVYWKLQDRWKKDVDRVEAEIQERKKQKAIETFRSKT